MINLNKKGTVILTHYRSGGTQLRSILHGVLEYIYEVPIDDTWELNFDDQDYGFDYNKYLTEIFCKEPNGYQTIQLNNPMVSSYIESTDWMEKIIKDYEVIVLERTDIKKALLSLPLWEKFIKEGYYDLGPDGWTSGNMNIFHNTLKKDPIRYTEIYQGIHFEFNDWKNYRKYLDFQLMLFLNRIRSNRYIASKYSLPVIYYSEYEFETTDKFIHRFKLKDGSDKSRLRGMIDTTRKHKIPYIEQDYLEYFDDKTKQVFKYWQL